MIRKTVLLSGIALVCGLLILVCLDRGHNWGGDFALYISETQALIQGTIDELFEANKFAMDHSIRHIGPYLYPIGLPLLLIPIYLVFGMNFWVMKVFCGLFLLGALFLLYALFEKHFEHDFYTFFIISFIAFNAIFITHANAVLSDLPFFFFSLLSILLMGSQRRTTWLHQSALGICMVVSYLIRDVGIVLVPTLFMFQLQFVLQNGMRATDWKLLLIPYLIFALGFGLNHFLVPRGGENALTVFLANLTPGQIIQSGKYYLKLIVSYFINGIIPGNALWLLLSPIVLFMALGAAVYWRQYFPYIGYIALTFAILLVWPYALRRFLFPVLPFMLFFMLKGLCFAAERISLKQRTLMLGLGSLLLIHIAANIGEVVQYSRLDTNKILTPEMTSIYDYIDENVADGQVIGFRKPRVLRLMTGRNSIKMDESHFDASPAAFLLIEKEACTDQINRYEKLFETTGFLLVKKRL